MNGLYIRYALTANLTIYAFVVRQFWCSASEVSLPDGTRGLVATIDGTTYTVTEASIRSALQLDDLNGPDMPLLAHMLNLGEPSFEQAQQQDVSQAPPSPIVAPHPSPDPMPSYPRPSSPLRIPFGPAPTSGVVTTDAIPDIATSFGPSEPVLETLTSPFRDDDTGGGSFHESPPRPHPATPTISPTRIATLEAELKAAKILHRDTMVLFTKRIKKLESKLKTKKRKLVLSNSENEEEER
nr:hypothetical protein [Tanacetum cinerariifolium]